MTFVLRTLEPITLKLMRSLKNNITSHGMVRDVVAVEVGVGEVPVVDLDCQGAGVAPALPPVAHVHVVLVGGAHLGSVP